MEREKAIKVIKEAMPTLWKETKDAIQTLIPELAENEDERIRKAIIQHILYKTKLDAATEHSWISYLEKQKEQKPTVYVPKFKVGDKVISTENTHLTYDILEVGLINELGKPDYRVEIFVDGKPGIPELKKEHNIHFIDCQKMDSWAELIEQKTKWSEEDERMLETIIYDFKAGYKASIAQDRWLKSLPERFNLQPKQEWSEEDEIMIDNVEQFLSDPSLKQLAPNTIKQTLAWLKSLRPQPHWKPSEGQMDALWNTLHPDDPYYVDLSSLYNDLKKL